MTIQIEPGVPRPLTVSVTLAARMLGLSRATFYRHQKTANFPRIYRFEGRSLVRTADLTSWVNNLGSCAS